MTIDAPNTLLRGLRVSSMKEKTGCPQVNLKHNRRHNLHLLLHVCAQPSVFGHLSPKVQSKTNHSTVELVNHPKLITYPQPNNECTRCHDEIPQSTPFRPVALRNSLSPLSLTEPTPSEILFHFKPFLLNVEFSLTPINNQRIHPL